MRPISRRGLDEPVESQGATTTESRWGSHGEGAVTVSRGAHSVEHACCGRAGDELREIKRTIEPDTASTIRERGAIGAVLLTVRAAAAQVVAFIGALVLAHMLVPADFGVVAVGAIIVTTGDFFADGGLGASLIRKAGDPTVDELRTLLAFQLAVAVVIALGLAVVASGIARMLASWTEAVIFARVLRRRAQLAVDRAIGVPVAAALSSALLAYALRPPLSNRLIDGITTAAVALAIYLALNFAFNRADLLATARRLRSLR